MSRTRLFFRNTLAATLLQLVNLAVGFVLPRVMLKVYGSEINGLVSSITQFISYFNLVEAGLAGAAVYALYKPLADKDYPAVNGIISAAKRYYTQSGIIFVALVIGLAAIYPLYITTKQITGYEMFFLVLVLGAAGVVDFFTLSKYRVLLTADQKAYVISLSSAAHILINTLLIVILASGHMGITVVRAIALTSVFLRSAILLGYCKKKYTYLNYKVQPDKRALDKRWDALFLQILGAIHTGAPVMILTLVLRDLKLVSVYTVYYMIVGGINALLGIFVNGLSASFGDVIARGQLKTLQKAYKQFEFAYYALITWAYTVAFITIMPFINLYTAGVHDANYNLPFVGFLFVLNGLLYNLKSPQGMLVISAGLYKETKWRTTIQGAIMLVCGCLFALFWGLPGVLFGSILSNLYRDIDLLFFIPRKVTKTAVTNTLGRMLRVFLCVGIAWIPFFFLTYTPVSFASWFLYAGIVAIYVLLVVGIVNLIFDKEELQNILQRIKSMAVKK